MWWVRKYFCEFTLSFTSSYEDTFNTDNLPICTCHIQDGEIYSGKLSREKLLCFVAIHESFLREIWGHG